MENKFVEMCADFRQANRIVALVQERIRDIVFYVKSQTKFLSSEIVGIKLFSKALANKNNKNGEFNLWYNMWPWDFIYSYVFEYRFFGSKEKDKGVMSIIQVSDDGFLEATGRECIEKYKSVDDSKSWLIFTYSEGKRNIPWEGKREWENDIFVGKDMVAKKYDMSEFYNEEKIQEIIQDFDKIVNENLKKTILCTK